MIPPPFPPPIHTSKLKTGIAYKLTFPNGKVYIGITCESLSQRVRRHIAYARAGKHYALSSAIRKHGEDSFVAEEVAIGTWQELKLIEIKLISFYNSLGAGGYNMTGGGEGSLGVPRSDVTRQKISKALAGRSMTFSDAHRARLSEVQRGKSIPEETRQKMRASAKARCASPMSQEQKDKIAAALRGRKRPADEVARSWATRKASAP